MGKRLGVGSHFKDNNNMNISRCWMNRLTNFNRRDNKRITLTIMKLNSILKV
jgi:hypothetical protein